MKILLILSLCFFSHLSQATQGPGESLDYSPFWDWKTLESKHFRVTYPAELKAQSKKSLEYFEEAHAIMAPILRWEPKNKVQIIVMDNTDASNGLTSPVGRFGIVLYITPPDTTFATAYYDDWLRLLVIHEYAHFLNMDPTKGSVYEALRFLIGDLVLPNSLWPSWMLEGLAVYFETRLTKAGRGRSPYWEMILRTAVKDRIFDNPEHVTLDKIQGPNPYFPGGDTAYMFGYHLINEITKRGKVQTTSTDGEQKLDGPDSVLGALSERSSWRVPYFINGALENTIGEDWYSIWSKWTNETKTRQTKNINTINKEPITNVKIEIPSPYGIVGNAVSPNGEWIAYNQDSSHEPSGVFLKNIKTNAVTRVADTILGTSLTFSHDGKWLIFTSLKRFQQYNMFSDLSAYSMDTAKVFTLTEGQRLKDPHWVKTQTGDFLVFTQSEGDRNFIAVSKIQTKLGNFELGKPEKAFVPGRYDAVSKPVFSPSGQEIVFSWKKNGTIGENIYRLKKQGASWAHPEALTQNQSRNRFPFYKADGTLFYISDQTGVENIYQYGASAKTNVVTGIWAPTFSGLKIYFSYFTSQGWALGSIQASELKNINVKNIELPRDFFPDTLLDSTALSQAKTLTAQAVEKDYSVFPSIYPRQWMPLAFFYPSGVYVGGQVLGFDAVDRHRYLLTGAYDTLVKKGDINATYENRSFGPTFSFSGQSATTALKVSKSGSLTSYARTQSFGLAVYYNLKNTFSSWTPIIGAEISRVSSFIPSQSALEPVAKSAYVPTADAQLVFSNLKSSRLAVAPEEGRTTRFGFRGYFDSGVKTYKYILTDTENFKITDHLVISPSAKFAGVSKTSNTYYPANVVLNGTLKTVLTQSSNPLDEFNIRGYPGEVVLVQNVALLSADVKFPLMRIFRGAGTNPLFFQNLSGVLFGESSLIPTKRFGLISLPSLGGGIRLDTMVFIHVPLNFALEYHYGLNRTRGGRGQVFAGINLTAISF